MKTVLYWLEVNKLSLNVSKTHYMVFSTRNKQVEDMNINIRDALIDRVKHTKFLGVLIDEKLNWKAHIDHVIKNCLKPQVFSSKLENCCLKIVLKRCIIHLLILT